MGSSEVCWQHISERDGTRGACSLSGCGAHTDSCLSRDTSVPPPPPPPLHSRHPLPHRPSTRWHSATPTLRHDLARDASAFGTSRLVSSSRSSHVSVVLGPNRIHWLDGGMRVLVPGKGLPTPNKIRNLPSLRTTGSHLAPQVSPCAREEHRDGFAEKSSQCWFSVFGPSPESMRFFGGRFERPATQMQKAKPSLRPWMCRSLPSAASLRRTHRLARVGTGTQWLVSLARVIPLEIWCPSVALAKALECPKQGGNAPSVASEW